MSEKYVYERICRIALYVVVFTALICSCIYSPLIGRFADVAPRIGDAFEHSSLLGILKSFTTEFHLLLKLHPPLDLTIRAILNYISSFFFDSNLILIKLQNLFTSMALVLGTLVLMNYHQPKKNYPPF